ncbi:methyltransferase domain-containing protein [archaeon]|nr:methyltransferase domain-containing protein [archaeon]
MVKTIFDVQTKEEIGNSIKEMEALLRKGFDNKSIKKGYNALNEEAFNELLSIAKAGIRNAREQKVLAGLYMNEEDYRFATNSQVAEYRAGRLKCENLLEIGCGVGVQTIAFAKECKKVVAVEKDERKIRYAEENAGISSAKNIIFIHGNIEDKNVNSELEKQGEFNAVFCDTERMLSEEIRKIDTKKPNIKEIIRTYKNCCIEIPPQMQDEALKGLDCEREYISVEHKLNRLNIYTGNLKKCDISAVSLPENLRIESKLQALRIKDAKEPMRYIYEIDDAVAKAGLIDRIKEFKNAFYICGFLTDSSLIKSSFIKITFEIVGSAKTKNDILKILKKANAGKVILRYGINPEEYWKERNYFEEKLRGDVNCCLFRFDGVFYAGKKVKS